LARAGKTGTKGPREQGSATTAYLAWLAAAANTSFALVVPSIRSVPSAPSPIQPEVNRHFFLCSCGWVFVHAQSWLQQPG
jgi:hypothetical protein